MSKHRIWILLRGLVREQRHWENFPDIFHSTFPDDRILLYDFPGNGQRFKESSATSIGDMVEDIRLHLSTNDVQQPVYIIALSLGAMVAVEWLNRYPNECAGAVLISTSLRGLNPFYQRLLPSNYAMIFKSLLFPGSIQQKEKRILNLVSNIVANDSNTRETIIDHWVNYAEQYPVSGKNGLRQLLSAMRFKVPAQCPEVPILVLRSIADHMVSPECSLTLATHWNLPLETHETAGHDIPLDDASWVSEKIMQWLNKL